MTKKSRHARHARRAAAREQASFPQEHERGGLFVTDELRKALEEYIEFDLELDRDRCLHGLRDPTNPIFPRFAPSDVQRATQIFDKPSFFIDGADSNDIIQGALGNCWFLSALATMSTAKGLVEKFCVARDEQVGVYGFIFFRDTAWVTVIIDELVLSQCHKYQVPTDLYPSLLFTSIPKFEELKPEERALYHGDKENYNRSARRSGKSLYFAKSGTHGETWVPLIEKAYAKLHGNYASLSGGEAGEAIEDLTGGITSFVYTKDILDVNAFWSDELLHANKDRLFGCAYDILDATRSGGAFIPTVNGLVGGHAYSVLRAVEYKDKRFVVIRNPWGECEWTGPWSDGSKEWTPEWLSALPVLGHAFGDDGQFVMEYKDFLENWEQVDRTVLFDSSWIMSSQWLKVTSRPLNLPWAFGDVSFTVSLPAPSSTVIVLSQLDDRYYRPISGRAYWSFDFVVYRKGESKPITASSPSSMYSRSVNAELHLQAGEYVVHVRLNRVQVMNREVGTTLIGTTEPMPVFGRKWPKVNQLLPTLTSLSCSTPINAFNLIHIIHFREDFEYIPIPPDLFAGQDLSELEARIAELKPKDQESKVDGVIETNESKADTSAVDGVTASKVMPAKEHAEVKEKQGGGDSNATKDKESEDKSEAKEEEEPKGNKEGENTSGKEKDKKGDEEDEVGDEEGDGEEDEGESGEKNEGDGEKPEETDKGEHEEGEGGEGEEEGEFNNPETDVVFLGLRVYTNKAAPAKVGGQLRHTTLAALTRMLGLGSNRQATQGVAPST
ncbi:hypothetical protein H0H92_007965 [Tricholoma furcatifolium]|nr:hypothetical protein H0H92_007965 [Tricholoma furcatifolium]